MIISIMINLKMITVLFHILDMVCILYLQHISAPTRHVQVGLVAAAAGQGNFTVLNPQLGWSHSVFLTSPQTVLVCGPHGGTRLPIATLCWEHTMMVLDVGSQLGDTRKAL